MAKVRHQTLSEHSLRTILKLVEATFDECGISKKGKELLMGLLTESELVMLGRRMQIARMLMQKKSHSEIQRELHVGFITIQAIEQWLEKKLPGYHRSAYVSKKGRRPSDYVPTDPFSFRALRRRYPMEFLLINLLLGDPRK